MTLLIVFITIAIGVSFICSVLEAALLSISPAFASTFGDDYPEKGKILSSLLDNIDRPLSAILSLNTVAHTVGATGAGAQAAAVFGNHWVGVFSALLTLGILVLSEIIPKTLGALYWRDITPLVVKVLPILIMLTLPLVWLSAWITKMIQKEKPAKIERQEIEALANVGLEEGVIDESESLLLKSLLKFRDVEINTVMTPIDVVDFLPESTSILEAVEQASPFSRIPLQQHQDSIFSGYVLKSELLQRASKQKSDVTVSSLKRNMISISDKTKLPFAIDHFIENHEHIAMVVDDAAKAVGILTMEDVIETLLNVEIVDESDPVVDMRSLSK